VGNMSYCRFKNTLGDLQDCYEVMEDEPKSDEEKSARLRLISICCDIAREFGDAEE
jgi:hypothetical protein